MTPGASAPKLVESLIHQAEAARASDLHLQMTGKAAQVFFRLDGMMVAATTLPEEVAERVFGRIKFLGRLKTYEESLPQDGRIDKADVGSRNDIRVATYPTVTGEKIVLRLFTEAAPKALTELEFPPEAAGELEGFLRQPAGLLLLTGPAGSGKTTTIYACLRQLAAAGGRHVITVEDPAEQIVPGVMQTEVNDAAGLTFAKAARHLLRQDPQVLVLGEIRDDETANLAVRAALTGHLVISTLRAGSCKGVIERLVVMCPDHFAVFSALEMILNQRLIRRVCPQCAGAGCEPCLRTGYQGRAPLVEWLRVDDAARAALRAHGAEKAVARHTLEAAAQEFLGRKLTNAAEVMRVLGRS